MVERTLTWKPLPLPSNRLNVGARDLFCSSNDPLHHSMEDIGRYFQLDGSTSAFSDVFFHTGFCGTEVEQRTLKTPALMVRRPGLELRDELFRMQQERLLATSPGFIVNGPRGCGKSYVLNYVVAAAQQADWLVLNIPRASDWTLGLGAKSTQAPNEAYRVTDRAYFKDVPAAIEVLSACHPTAEPRALRNRRELLRRALLHVARGIARAFCATRGVALVSHPRESFQIGTAKGKGTFGNNKQHAHIRRCLCPTESYPHLMILQSDASWGGLYENPEATSNLLISIYLSQKSKLQKIKIKDEGLRSHYAQAMSNGLTEPTLADMLALVAHDRSNSFSEFPMPLRPVIDFFDELQRVTEYPVLVVIDGWNSWQHLSNTKHWHSSRPLHAQELLVPRIFGNMLDYGSRMQNGVMLCGISHAGASRPSLPRQMRKDFVPPIDWRLNDLGGRAPNMLPCVREVPAYSASELQRVLEFYALAGHMRNQGLQEQLRSGSLRRKVALITSSIGEDVFKLCSAM